MYRELIAEALVGHAWARLQKPCPERLRRLLLLARLHERRSRYHSGLSVGTRQVAAKNIPDLIRKYCSGQA